MTALTSFSGYSGWVRFATPSRTSHFTALRSGFTQTSLLQSFPSAVSAVISRGKNTTMNYELLFVGVGTTIIGTLFGCWLSAKLNFGFQKKLLNQQLEFLKRQADADATIRQEIHNEWKTIFTEFRNMVNRRAMNLGERHSRSDS
jgi:hypothetical protein